MNGATDSSHPLFLVAMTCPALSRAWARGSFGSLNQSFPSLRARKEATPATSSRSHAFQNSLCNLESAATAESWPWRQVDDKFGP